MKLIVKALRRKAEMWFVVKTKQDLINQIEPTLRYNQLIEKINLIKEYERAKLVFSIQLDLELIMEKRGIPK